MSWVAAAIAGTGLIMSAIQSENQKRAATEAAAKQLEATETGLDIQREMFQTGLQKQEELVEKSVQAPTPFIERGITEQETQLKELTELIKPYATAGEQALLAQMSLMGLQGQQAQQKAVSDITQSPEFQALSTQGEEAILQSASATGGLRGGNVQGVLAQFRPNLLQNMINQKFQQFGGVAGRGQQAAGTIGGAQLQTGQSIAQNLSRQGFGQSSAYAIPAGMMPQLYSHQSGQLVGLEGDIGDIGAEKEMALGEAAGTFYEAIPKAVGTITGRSQ